eukprot:TRINITY_DN13826_c0_g1_i1.p1 TRINITY_DN13826_c0_g1~~TRINITY_DN13826_c0_g1_i1.p1  ORF type:complete len:309 (-),score=27.91 TRINITY_DN13826_c0_g1_i1:793-1719(-)
MAAVTCSKQLVVVRSFPVSDNESSAGCSRRASTRPSFVSARCSSAHLSTKENLVVRAAGLSCKLSALGSAVDVAEGLASKQSVRDTDAGFFGLGKQQGLVRKQRRKCGVWTMEVADPLENYRDSFGNECLVERRARKDLETNESYKKLVSAVDDTRARMKLLVSEESYEDAASARDTLNMLEFRKRLLELSAKPRVLYRVGDVVVHRRYGYRGVVYGHDPQCSAPKDWQEAMKIDLLPEGREQPFYHVLVDTRDRPGGMSTYVAQENMVLHKRGRPVLHPWIPKFFVGFQDGTYVPGSKLRQVYPNDW